MGPGARRAGGCPCTVGAAAPAPNPAVEQPSRPSPPAPRLVAEPVMNRTVARVRFRAAIAVFAAIAAFFVTTAAPVPLETDPDGLARYRESGQAQSTWITATQQFDENIGDVRENRTSVWNQYYRLGPGPDIKFSQFPQPEPANADRIRVLVIGDSYAWGHGYDEPAMRWPDRLEAELNARTAPGTFEVVTQARNNFSAFGQADWFTKQRFDELDPYLVLLGYFENDIFPSFTEPSICPKGGCVNDSVDTHPAYLGCLSGERGVTSRLVRHLVAPFSKGVARSLLARHCDPERIAKEIELPNTLQVYENPPRSPYWSKFLDAYSRLRAAAGDRPFLVFETPVFALNPVFDTAIAPVFDVYGYRIVPRTATERVIGELAKLEKPGAGLALAMLNPADGHASPLLTAAFASDTADEILATVPADRLAAAKRSATPPLRTLIAATHPAPVEVGSLDENRAVVTFVMRNDRLPRTVTAAGDLPPQYVPCLALGAPYLQISFDPTLPADTRLAFRFDAVSGTTRELFGYGYDDREQPVHRSLGRIRAGQTVELTAGEFRGLRLAAVGETCALDRPIFAPTTTVTLTRR